MAFNLKDEEETKEYIENLGVEYRFGCYHEKKPEGNFLEMRIHCDLYYVNNIIQYTIIKLNVKTLIIFICSVPFTRGFF